MRDCGVPVFARYTVRAAQTVKVRDVQNVQAAIGGHGKASDSAGSRTCVIQHAPGISARIVCPLELMHLDDNHVEHTGMRLAAIGLARSYLGVPVEGRRPAPTRAVPSWRSRSATPRPRTTCATGVPGRGLTIAGRFAAYAPRRRQMLRTPKRTQAPRPAPPVQDAERPAPLANGRARWWRVAGAGLPAL
jgi:hypothetical protein